MPISAPTPQNLALAPRFGVRQVGISGKWIFPRFWTQKSISCEKSSFYQKWCFLVKLALFTKKLILDENGPNLTWENKALFSILSAG